MKVHAITLSRCHIYVSNLRYYIYSYIKIILYYNII